MREILHKGLAGSIILWYTIGEEKYGEYKVYHFDYRGSTVAITDIYGSITDTFAYDTYGNMTEHIDESFVIFGYNGRDGVVTDKNGLIYMRARYYSPAMRRFVNADIIAGEISNAVTLNRYAYANGNPVSNVDPFELAVERTIESTNKIIHSLHDLNEGYEFYRNGVKYVKKGDYLIIYGKNDFNITDTFKYDTYGKLISRTGTNFVIFGYNGRDGVITDKNGLIYMRARYYSPDMRRFINADILHGEISDSTSLNRYSYVNGNPVSFVDPFGLDREKSGFNDWFDKIKKLFGLSVDEFKRLTAEGKLDWFLKLTLGAEKDNNGIYHIRQDWWQSWNIIGYNDVYDIAFNIGTGVTGTTMAREKFPFTVNGKEYIVWVWKGDYINLGSGAEAGIYEKSAIPGHWLTSTDNNLKMSLSLKEIDSGDILFNYSPTQPQWWITGFDPLNQDAQANNLQSTVTIDFSQNSDLYEGFSAAYENNLESPWKFNGKVATLIW